MESEEKADLDGEEYIELLDPMTDGAIDPDSVRERKWGGCDSVRM